MARGQEIAGLLQVVIVAGVVGCGAANNDPPGPIRLRAEAAGVAFASFFPARLDLVLGTAVSAFEFSASAGSDRGVWTARAALTREQAVAGVARVEVGSTAPAPGQVQIAGSRLLQADSGTLDVTFGRGVAAGVVSGASPELLNSQFSGELLLSCWVPPSALPPASGPTANLDAPKGREALVVDAKLESAACMPFRVLE